MSNISLRNAIRDDPDRFMIDMDLRKVFDKLTFDKEVDTAVTHARGKYRKQATKWTEESDWLFAQPKTRELIITNVERDQVYTGRRNDSTGKRIRIRGHDNGDGTYTIVRLRKLKGGKKVRYLQTRKKGR